LSRRKTILERIHPDVPEFTILANEWKIDAINRLLGFFWKGCDALISDIIKPAGGLQGDELSLERSLNSRLAPRVSQSIDSSCPFYFQHKPDEFQTLKTPSSQPPEPDFAFISRVNERIMLPIEAKVIKTDDRTSEYIDEIKENYLTCNYAPFSKVGAMVGYLLEGKPEKLFKKISKGLFPRRIQLSSVT
jgi:hypothetical protein